MSDEVIAGLVMIASSALYALSFVLQHKGTQQAIGEGATGTGNPAARLARNPFWVTGIVLFGVSFLVHLVALGIGAVAVVQPLIVTELIFIPPLAALLSHAHVGLRTWLWILTLTGALAVFMFVAMPGEGDRVPSTSEWLLSIGLLVVACGVLMGIGSRLGPTPRATLFGLAAGLVNAFLAIAAKGAFSSPKDGLAEWLTDPLVWLTVVVALTTVASTALAFRTGPITASSPAMIAVNPIVSTLWALWLFGETIRTQAWAIAAVIACTVVITIAVFALGRSEAVHADDEFDGVIEEGLIAPR